MFGLVLLLLFDIFILIIFVVIGRLFYKTKPKTAYFIWCFTLYLLIRSIHYGNNRTEIGGDQYLDKFIGTFKIDISNSKYESLNIKDYNSLYLTVKKDHSFEFSKETPFFNSKTGHWQHMDDGDISWTEVSVGEMSA